MPQWNSVDEVLDFAIGQEEEAAKFYTDLAEKAAQEWMKGVFRQFAKEELGHKQKLLEVKNGKLLVPSQQKVVDLKMSDYLVAVEPTPDMDYQQALVVAMQKEKAAFRMYSDLAESVGDENVKNIFLALAQEEAKHKLRFEVEYDQYVMTDN